MANNIDKLKKHLTEKGRDKSYNELAIEYDIRDKHGIISGEKVRGIWRRLKTSRIPSQSVPKIVKEDNKTYLDYSGASITSLEDLIDAAGINMYFWDVENFRVSTWQDFKDETKYAVKAVFDRSKEARDGIREEFIKAAKQHAPSYRPIKYPKATQDQESVMYELCLPDLHIGKISMADEVGHTYNSEVAVSLFEKAIERLLKYTKLFHIDRIVFPIGNDMLNSDGFSMTTTNGTPQHDDVNWQRSFTYCREVIVKIVDMLRKIAPVDVIVVPGNHDFERMFYIGDAIYCWYNNCEEVQVFNDMSPRKYYRYGKTLLGFTHGNNEKHADLPLIMAKEMPREWAEVEFTEWHTGHLHKSKSLNWVDIDERFGTVVRILPSLSGSDSWHHRNGYVKNIRSAQGYMWGYETGYKGHFQVNINELI